jgi:sialidase-1
MSFGPSLLKGSLASICLAVAWIQGPAAPAAAAEKEAVPLLEQADLYVSGREGYHTYRIPSVIVTLKGTVLAFCEGRKHSSSDTGDIDMLLRRSTDGGRTFAKQQVVWDDGPNTCGNPCPVVDRTSGTIFLLLTHNLGQDDEGQILARKSKGTRTPWISKSLDDGLTWSRPVEITKSTKKPDWTWYATGPGAGIQLRSGRLVIPCCYADPQIHQYLSHIIYSDDHGDTWRLGGTAARKTDECEAVELADGAILLNMRTGGGEHRCRATSISRDQGLSWSKTVYDQTLVEPECQGSIRRYSSAGEGGKSRILFSNPAQTGQRTTMTARISYDECKTWPVHKVLHAGPAAYSCLAVAPDGGVLCLYERGDKHAYEKITLARFNLQWLSDGKD